VLTLSDGGFNAFLVYLSIMRVIVVVLGMLAAGCGGHAMSSPTEPTTTGGAAGGAFVLRAAVVDPASVDFVLPLGNLNPPGHTLPTDHIYFYVGFLRPAIRGVPVFAPGDGTVQTILRRDADVKLFVRATATFSYYIDHVVLDGAIREGTAVTAGLRLGTSGTGGFGVDLGVLNMGRTLSFAVPARYSLDTLNADAPLKYYEEPLRSQLYALVRRDGNDKDGRIDFDVPGRLTGNWFLDDLPLAESSLPAGWPKQLAFVFDNVQPAQPRISIGGTLAMTGVFGIDPGAPAFDSVSPDSGLVRYRLLLGGALGAPNGPPMGTLLVQMLDSSRVRVEAVPGSAATSFSAAARVYTR
jgi:hypothetical protein